MERDEKARDERHNQWAVYFLLRPLSGPVAARLRERGISADQVTWAGLVLALLLPLFALAPQMPAALLVAIGAILFLLLDCVDGDLARLSGTASRRGAYLDMMADLVFRCAFYLAIGLLAWRAGGSIAAPVIGVLSAWAALAARWSRAWLTSEMPGEPDAYFDPARTARRKPADYLFFFLTGLDQLFPLLLLFAAWSGRLSQLVWFIAAYSLLDFAATQISVWRRLG